tara:strand:+ start:226 stop:687 length:462 start_codon:yes stop_codon:yes gene_type:complete
MGITPSPGVTMKFKALILGIALTSVAGLAGCSSPHSPVSTKRYEMTPPAVAPSQVYAAHENKIWVTTADIPADVKYEVIQQIDVGSKWYGDVERLNPHFAKLARKVGADAVIRVKTWHSPNGFSWAAPQGQGYAVKIISPEKFDLTSLSGGWY